MPAAAAATNVVILRHRSFQEPGSSRIFTHHGIHRLERAGLPRCHFRDERVGDLDDQIGRNVDGVNLGQELLNLADRQAPRIERQHFVVEARHAARVLRNQLRLKGPGTVARNLEGDRAVFGEDALLARVLMLNPTHEIS